MQQLLIKKEYFVYDKKTIIERIVFSLNKLKKCLSVGLVIAIVLSLTGCGLFSSIKSDPVTKEELVSSALECLQDAESIDISSILLLETTMEKDGDDYSLTAELVLDYQEHMPSNSLYFNADFEATEEYDGDEDDASFNMEAYMVEENGTIYSYFDEGDGWMKTEKDEIPDILDVEKLLKSINKKIENFTLSDDKCTLEGKSCYAVSGKLSKVDYLLEMYDIELIFDEIDIDDLEAYISLYIDAKSKELVSINLDFSSSFVELYEDVDDVEDVEVEQFALTIIYNSFNDVDEITVPKSVKNAVEDTSTKPTEPEETKPTEPTEPEETKPAETQPTTPPETTPTNPSNNTLSSNWKDLDVEINGVLYKFPYDYEMLKQQGWTINMADYGYADGYILNKGGSVSSTLKLYNAKYGSEYRDFYISCGFKNYDTSAKDILECDLWCIVLDATYGFSLKDNYPKVVIAKNITWGSTKAEVEAAFGTPKDVYESDSGYVIWTYDNDYHEQMRLTIYDSFGLAAIELKNYD